MPRRRKGERALGPYRHGRGWRVIEVAADGSRETVQFSKEKEAEIYVLQFNSDVHSADLTTTSALDAYLRHLTEKGNKKTSTDRTRWSVSRFFPDPLPLRSLRPKACERLYFELSKALAVDSHRNALAEVKTFLGWCVKQHLISSNPASDIEGVGRRKRGKKQLRVKSTRKWYQKALELAEAGDDGAIAALCALLLGMRASEIVAIRVADLDEDEDPCDLLWIPDAKTDAGKRALEVPDVLRVHLVEQARGKPATAILFPARAPKDSKDPRPPHWRDWPRKQVKRICELAGVDPVGAHAMRGALATITLQRGLAPHLAAMTLGHEDERTTVETYAERGAAETGARRRGLVMLEGGKKG